MARKLYVDIHVLQTVPPSCVNRDDTGSPKTAIYGGVTRARVSSQSWKKAVRDMFKDMFPREELGLRTKKIVRLVQEEIEKSGDILDAEKKAIDILKLAGLKIKNADDGTDALFFMSVAQAKALAKLVAEQKDTNKKEVQKAMASSPSIDIALFGRMVADNPSYNTDASCQVAHAISTHKVVTEFDYFTAADDLPAEDHAGAGHIGNVEFNSSTLYRYSTVAVHQLFKQLGKNTNEAVQAFIKAFVLSMPTGKQNTFANRTVPDAVYITLRKDQPVNLVGAFEKPVYSRNDGYTSNSALKLKEHAQKVYQDFLNKPDYSFVIGELLADIGIMASLNDNIVKIGEILENELAELVE